MTQLRVLYVDDDPDICEVATFALELDPGIEVRSEPCGLSGLATAALWRPDAILLDVMMPLMDGPTTLVHLRSDALTCDIPVIFITARAQSREIDEFIKQGARDVITKPFDPMTLAEELRRKIVA
jgi:two-component system OmpR family response regulator